MARRSARRAAALLLALALVAGTIALSGCSSAQASAAGGQLYTVTIGQNGYEPSTVQAQAGSPVTLRVGPGSGCRTGFVIPSLGVRRDVSGGPTDISLGPLKPGTYPFSCPMGMVRGQLVVK